MSFLLGFRLMKAHKIPFFLQNWCFCKLCAAFRGHSKNTFAQDPRVLTPPSAPLFALVSFWALPSPPRCFGWNSPSPPQFLYLWYLDKRNYNEYYYLLSHSEISVKWTPLVHDKSVRFMEMSAFRVHLKIRSLQKQTRNPLPVMIFQVQIYWKD